MRHSLFVYGTLQLPEKLQTILGKIPSLTPAMLTGYRVGLVARADFPGIVPARDSSVQGQLLSPLSQDDLVKLDRYEGELYHRIRVDVATGNGIRNVWTYCIVPWARERVTTQEWSIDQYRQRKQPRWTYHD